MRKIALSLLLLLGNCASLVPQNEHTAEIYESAQLNIQNINLKIGDKSPWIGGCEKILVLFPQGGLLRFFSEQCPMEVRVIKKNEVVEINCRNTQIQNISNNPVSLYIIEKKN